MDVQVENHGTIMLFRAISPAALDWLREHTDGQWLGNGLAVEPRYAIDLAEGLIEEGFAVE